MIFYRFFSKKSCQTDTNRLSIRLFNGEMSERPKELDWKSSIGVKAYQGFESLSLRHKKTPERVFFLYVAPFPLLNM